MILSQFVKNQSVWSDKNEVLIDSILEDVWSGRESSTVNQYCLSLRKFLAFSKENDFSTHMPFSSTNTAIYLSHLKTQNHSKSSIDTTLASLKWIHSFIPGINQWNNPMNDDFLSKIISSSRRRPSGVKNQKKPITGIIIKNIVEASNLESLLDLRNCLIMMFAFCLLLRHNEISHMTLNHFEETDEGFKILIPKSKTDKYRNGSHVLLSKSIDNISVSNLLKKYLFLTKLKIGMNHFLFFPLKKVGVKFHPSNKILSYASYRDIIKQAVEKVGLDPKLYGTHSLRSGGATQLAPVLTEYELLTSGRWSDSRSIRSYVEMSDHSRFGISDTLQSTFSNDQSGLNQELD